MDVGHDFNLVFPLALEFTSRKPKIRPECIRWHPLHYLIGVVSIRLMLLTKYGLGCQQY